MSTHKMSTDKMSTDIMSNTQNVDRQMLNRQNFDRKKNFFSRLDISMDKFFFSKVVKSIFKFLVFEIWLSLDFFSTEDIQTPPPPLSFDQICIYFESSWKINRKLGTKMTIIRRKKNLRNLKLYFSFDSTDSASFRWISALLKKKLAKKNVQKYSNIL